MLARWAVRILRRLGVRRASRKVRGLSGAYKTYTLGKLSVLIIASCLAASMSGVEITVSNPHLGKVVRLVFHLAGPMGILGAGVTVGVGYFYLKLRVRDILIAIALGLVIGMLLTHVATKYWY